MSQRLSDLPVGSLVKDTGSLFLNKPIIWKIADKNHNGYPTGAITLITERCIAMRCFDAKESSNSTSDRQSYGNGRYAVSNIRQWLNSDAEAGKWYSAQHSADATPNSSNVWQSSNVAINPYDTNAGFLNGFSDNFKKALLETSLVVAKHTVDGGGSETVTDKIFLASNTEVGLANENNIAEGTLLPIFSDDASRIAYVTAEGLEDSNYASDPANDTTAWYWWLRTPYMDKSGRARGVNSSGALNYYNAYNGNYGVRPLCNLPSSILVSDTTDADGCYTLSFPREMNFDLSTPIEAETMPERIAVELGAKIPFGATWSVKVCNNANDAEPTWEDCTAEVKAYLVHVFTNKTKTAENWAINIKVEVEATGIEGECYVSGIGGNWE